jgi:hypothetical protein
MDLKMPIKIKEPESTPTRDESHPSEYPPEHLLVNVVMTFSGDMPRLTAEEIGVVAEGGKVEEAFRHLVEAARGQLASSEGARAELLRYPSTTWFRFVDPDLMRHRPPKTNLWPEGENVEDFIAAATEGRYEEEEDEPDS